MDNFLGELSEKDRRPKLFNLEMKMVVQWLRFHACIAGGVGSIPGQGTKIPHATGHLSPCSATGEADVPPQGPSTAKTERKTQYFKNIEVTPRKILLDCL